VSESAVLVKPVQIRAHARASDNVTMPRAPVFQPYAGLGVDLPRTTFWQAKRRVLSNSMLESNESCITRLSWSGAVQAA
jgi:hypothetical protein